MMSFGQRVRVMLAAALAGALVAIVALLWLDWASGDEVTLGPAAGAVIVVYVDGEVVNPGLVELPAGARLQQAIEAAGGLTDAANLSGLNLAARIGDGEHVTIPGTAPHASPTGSGEAAATPEAALIDINTASAAELEQLPGIGPAIAGRIVEHREIYGPFTSVEQLDEVTGISAAMVEELRPMVTIGG